MTKVLVTNVIGPQGVKGDTGLTGPKGDTGNTGGAGPQGVKGDTGLQGPKGDTGNTGPQGAKGDTGNTGPAGSGHTIQDSSNALLAQRSKLKFVGATLADDAAGDRTVVTITGSGGSVSLRPWTSTATFVTGDYTGYAGDIFQATADNTNVAPDPVQHPQIPAPNVANAASWQLNGGATIDSTGLVLISGQNSTNRTAIYTTLVPLDGLDVTFDWTTTGGADGFSFGLLDPANTTNTSIGGNNLGLQGLQGIRLTWDYYSGANWARLFYDDVQVGADLTGGTGSATVQVQVTLVSGNTYSLTVKRNGVTIVNAQQITTDFATARLAFGAGSGGISATTKVTALSCPPVSTWTRVLDAVSPTELGALATRVTATEAFGPRLTTAETNITSQIARLGALETGAPVLLRTATHGGNLSSFVFTPVGGAPAAGRLLVVACNVSQYNATRTVTPPSGWTLRLDQLSGLNRQFVFTKVAGASETTTYTFGITSGENHSALFAEFSGGDFRGITANTTASTTAAASTDPVGGRSGVAIWWSSSQNNGSSTVSTGWSKSTEVSSGGTWAGIVMANSTAPTTVAQSLAPVVTTTMSPIVGSATILVGTEPANGHVIRDEGVQLPQRGSIDFVGANVTATDDAANGKTVVTIVGSNRFYQDWAGIWSSTIDYPIGAIVSRNYILYVALTDPPVGSDPASQSPVLGAWNAGSNTMTSTNWFGLNSYANGFTVAAPTRVKGIQQRWGGAGGAGSFGLASALSATPTWLIDSAGVAAKQDLNPSTGTVTVTFAGHVDLVPGVTYYIAALSCAANIARADSWPMPTTGLTQVSTFYGSGASFASGGAGGGGEFRLLSESGAPWDVLPVSGGSNGNLAYGKSYTFSPSPHSAYTDPSPSGNRFVNGVWTSSGQKLTDGISSGTFNDGNTVAWDTGTATVIRIDLETAKQVGRVTVRGWHGTSGMYRPLGIVVNSSNDDATWVTQASHTGLASGGQGGLARFRMDETFNLVTARYWQITITRDSSGLLLLDELEIF